MDYKRIDEWMDSHGIVLEQGFVGAIRMLARAYKKQ